MVNNVNSFFTNFYKEINEIQKCVPHDHQLTGHEFTTLIDKIDKFVTEDSNLKYLGQNPQQADFKRISITYRILLNLQLSVKNLVATRAKALLERWAASCRIRPEQIERIDKKFEELIRIFGQSSDEKSILTLDNLTEEFVKTAKSKQKNIQKFLERPKASIKEITCLFRDVSAELLRNNSEIFPEISKFAEIFRKTNQMITHTNSKKFEKLNLEIKKLYDSSLYFLENAQGDKNTVFFKRSITAPLSFKLTNAVVSGSYRAQPQEFRDLAEQYTAYMTNLEDLMTTCAQAQKELLTLNNCSDWEIVESVQEPEIS